MRMFSFFFSLYFPNIFKKPHAEHLCFVYLRLSLPNMRICVLDRRFLTPAIFEAFARVLVLSCTDLKLTKKIMVELNKFLGF
jgi:hypothetical protein